jgi:uncharacterized membrane protein
MQNIPILILSFIGIAITLYLTIAHILKKKVICPINSKSCNIVLDSKYSKTFGVKNEIIGLAYYSAIIITFFVIESTTLILAIKTASILAMLYSIILLCIQIKVLKNYCSWCIMTAIINLLLAILIIII